MLSDSHGCASPSQKRPKIFRLNDNGIGPEVVRDVLLDRGWEEFVEGESEDYDWNLWWRTNRFRHCDYTHLMPWQRLNHFPKTVAITKKDTLARNMRRMRGVYGVVVFNFTPIGFNLPNDYTKFVAEYSKSQQEAAVLGKKTLWICKPADMSRGRGIFIFQELSELTYDCCAVAQRYITNPLLIGGYKFDLRIYVLVTSFTPLHIYMYQEGITRFSTEKFDLNSIENLFCHLTNTSINKLGPAYTMHKETVGPGCKWSLSMLRDYFHQQGIDDDILWQRICNIVTLTILAQAPTVPKSSGCLELFGFDILIDDTLKPWLLEVNFSPALGLDCAIDHTIKRALINDIVELMQFEDGDEDRGGDQFVKLKQKQAYGSSTRGSMTSIKRDASKSGTKSKTLITNSTGSPSRLNKTGPRAAVSKVSSKNRVPSNDKLASHNKGRSRGTSSQNASQKQMADDADNDYDEEIAAVCKRTSSEVSVKEDTKVSSGEPPSTAQGNSRLGKPGSALNNLSLPSLEESRKQLDSRRELIRSRQQSSLASPNRRQSVNSLRHSSSTDITSNRSGTLSSMSSSKCPSRMTLTCDSPNDGMRNYPRNAGTRKVPALSSNNSQGTGKGHDVQSPTLKKPVFTRTGLKSHSKIGTQSIMNEKGASSSRRDPAVGRSKPPMLPPQRVGDFVLTFPFNEVTRRASVPSLDIRTIVKETQKQLRRIMCKAHSTKCLTQAASQAAPQRGAGVKVKQQFEEGIIQWAPLKSQALLNGQC